MLKKVKHLIKKNPIKIKFKILKQKKSQIKRIKLKNRNLYFNKLKSLLIKGLLKENSIWRKKLKRKKETKKLNIFSEKDTLAESRKKYSDYLKKFFFISENESKDYFDVKLAEIPFSRNLNAYTRKLSELMNDKRFVIKSNNDF